jgi:hypothetical protein
LVFDFNRNGTAAKQFVGNVLVGKSPIYVILSTSFHLMFGTPNSLAEQKFQSFARIAYDYAIRNYYS